MVSANHTTPQVLIAAPIGADGRNIATVLTQAGLETKVCIDLAVTITALSPTAGALVLTEEATVSPDCGRLRDALRDQPPWSDLPIILITSGGDGMASGTEAIRCLGSPHNLTILERPLRATTLVATVRAALVARRRQYQVRDLLEERDALLGSLEAQVADRTAKLRQMVEELEAFSYSVSHDLRSPLRVLDGYARALSEDYQHKLDAQAQQYLAKISSTAQRMDRLTQDILAYSRASRVELTMAPVNLDLLVRDAIEQYPVLSAARGSIQIAPSLGWVMGHGPSLMQCLSNLLENALKFASPERPSRVDIRTEQRAGRIRVLIEDNGTGIDLCQRERIFGLFERATTTQVPGTGIGLAIVKKAVARMNGTVGVERAPVHGCIFWFELAAADVASTERAPGDAVLAVKA
ncbi:MAG TPA: ATP-binding protein [Opitutaceae bacterium]|nr:ATP-binding protein [Opitutaceae bacterium]